MTVDERTHIVPLPTWTLPARIAQAVLAFVLLIFIAVPTSIWGGFAAFGLGLFTVSLAISTYLAPDLTARSASQRSSSSRSTISPPPASSNSTTAGQSLASTSSALSSGSSASRFSRPGPPTHSTGTTSAISYPATTHTHTVYPIKSIVEA